jgi:hypothetical protein
MFDRSDSLARREKLGTCCTSESLRGRPAAATEECKAYECIPHHTTTHRMLHHNIHEWRRAPRACVGCKQNHR